jgi:hypothetical protein
MDTKKDKTENIESQSTEAKEKYVVNYIIHIHDNQGTINIKQSGQPDEDPPNPIPTNPTNP